jgi:hypothetical protein
VQATAKRPRPVIVCWPITQTHVMEASFDSESQRHAGWNSATRLPEGSTSTICEPPGPVTMALRNWRRQLANEHSHEASRRPRGEGDPSRQAGAARYRGIGRPGSSVRSKAAEIHARRLRTWERGRTKVKKPRCLLYNRQQLRRLRPCSARVDGRLGHFHLTMLGMRSRPLLRAGARRSRDYRRRGWPARVLSCPHPKQTRCARRVIRPLAAFVAE